MADLGQTFRKTGLSLSIMPKIKLIYFVQKSLQDKNKYKTSKCPELSCFTVKANN
jgi:hypothetical protein